jgi:hypothetical protein
VILVRTSFRGAPRRIIFNASAEPDRGKGLPLVVGVISPKRCRPFLQPI